MCMSEDMLYTPKLEKLEYEYSFLINDLTTNDKSGIQPFPHASAKRLSFGLDKVGGAFTLSVKGDLLDYSYNLQNFHDGPVNMVATISTGLA